MIPDGFEPITTLENRHGRIELYRGVDHGTVLAVASGRIGPRLLDYELEVLRQLPGSTSTATPSRSGSPENPAGPRDTWSYVVDTSGVTLANPLNVLWLRRLGSLPGLDGYRVVAPIAPIRWAFRLLRHLVGADGVDEDLTSALAMLRAG